MSKKKLRDLTAVFFVGLFVMTFEPVFIWLLIGAMVLLASEKEEKTEKLSKKNVLFAIGADARRHQLRMPQNKSIRSLLIKVYRKFDRSVKLYPHLESEYQEVIDEMWISMAEEEEFNHWNSVISGVLAGWPEETKKSAGGVQEKLKKVKELSEQWDEAKSEALGGSRV